jgi:cytoskeletal protein RodZ
VARYGPPDDPNYPDDNPTEYLGPPPGEPIPWYRKPAALVAFGALGAVLIALIVFGLAKAIMGGDEPPESTPLTPLTTTSRSVTPTTTSAPETVTETYTPTTTEPTTTTTTTTTPPTTTTTTTTTPTTSVSTSTSTETVTETVTPDAG